MRRLGALRKEHPALATGDFAIVYHDDHSIAYERRVGADRLLIAANMGDKPLTLDLTDHWQPLDTDLPPDRSVTVPPIGACICKEVSA